MTNNLIFKTRDELTATKCKCKAFSLTAFKCNAILEAFKVNYYIIAKSSSSVFYSSNSFSLLLKLCNFSVDIFISYSVDNLFNFYTLVAFNFNFWLCDTDSLENNACFLVYFSYFDVRTI